MNDAKSANRLRLTVILFLSLGIALASFWLLQVMRKETNEHGPDKMRNDPDYFVENFTFVRLAKSGQAHYIVNGALLTHRPRDDSSEIAKPVMHSLAPERAPITIHAAHAHINHNSTEVQLDGDVHLERPAFRTTDAVQLRTQSLLVLPDDEVMKTAAPVDAKIGAATVTATGMQYDNVKGKLELLSQGHSTFPPHQKTR